MVNRSRSILIALLFTAHSARCCIVLEGNKAECLILRPSWLQSGTLITAATLRQALNIQKLLVEPSTFSLLG